MLERNIENELFHLYYDTEPAVLERLDLCRGDDDFRCVYITDDGKAKLAIKHTSNTFTDAERVRCWARLMDEYNKLGIYCPRIVTNKHGERIYEYTEDGREYLVYAEEFSKYDTAEHIGVDGLRDENGRPSYIDDMLRSVGKVAAARFDFMKFRSAYCLLEPFCEPDTTDEGTECAEAFFAFVKEELPGYSARADKLKKLYYANQEALRNVYAALPESCFQADLGPSNVLLDGENKFAGLIDFNLSGREPVLNYTVRAALWKIYDNRLYNRDDGDRELFWYDDALDRIRINEFLHNIECIEEFYDFSDTERAVFPVLFRYMNSFWWQHTREIKRIKDDDAKITMLLDWLEHQMTRDDIRLP